MFRFRGCWGGRKRRKAAAIRLAAVESQPPWLYCGPVYELNEHLARVQDIVTRTSNFQFNEASDPKEFSQSVVEDLGVLAEAVSELLKRTEI